MENKAIAKTLRLLSQLMELHNENPYKVKSLASAAYKIDKTPFPIARKSIEQIEEINGIGQSTASKVWELLQTGTIREMDELLQNTPEGVVEMMRIKGIGPKKVNIIWKELGIENIGELFYACNENRLIEAKGFGLKTQEEIKKVIEFQMASKGRFLYAQVEEMAENFIKSFKKLLKTEFISFTGAYRRRCEIIDAVEILVGDDDSENISQEINNLDGFETGEEEATTVEITSQTGLKFIIHHVPQKDFAYQLAMSTGNESHVEELNKRLFYSSLEVATEAEVYQKAGLPFIEPELREGMKEFEWADNNTLPSLIEQSDLKGALHNHSTWSDGVHTIEEMALFCRDELKLQYLGISDHSKSAFYASGLNEEQILAQHEEIDRLNKNLAPFKIFKGIESDILFDGSLDYSSEVLAGFDFVVASVHSILKMNEDKATERLIKAIENPYTTILGHPTGRLLLTRSGYPINYKKIIDACSANKVVIEINSNPLRLDMDWRWHAYAIEKGVILSINPDAHRNEGFYDMRYGATVARKGGVSAKNCLNAMSVEEISAYFNSKKA